MTIKPFAIQGADLTLGGVNLQAGTTGVVIPGVTQATSYKVEEIEDNGDQSVSFQSAPIIIDYITLHDYYDRGSSSGRAEYSVDQLDNDGYIDGISIDSSGSYSSVESDQNDGNDVYAYTGTDTMPGIFTSFQVVDWTQIPFRPKMRAGEIENVGGGASLGNLSVDGYTLVDRDETDNFLSLAQGNDHIRLATSHEKSIYLTTNHGRDAPYGVPQEVSKTWEFDKDGSITFPDGSVQTTAYTGGAGGAGGYLLSVGDSTSDFNSFRVVTNDGIYTYYCGNATGLTPGNSPTIIKVDSYGTIQWQSTLPFEGTIDSAYAFMGQLAVTFKNTFDSLVHYVCIDTSNGSVIDNGPTYYYDPTPDTLFTRDSILGYAGGSPAFAATVGAVLLSGGQRNGLIFGGGLGGSFTTQIAEDENGDTNYFGITHNPITADIYAVGNSSFYGSLVTRFTIGAGIDWHMNIDCGQSPIRATSVAYGSGYIYVASSNTGNGNDGFLTKMDATTGAVVWQRAMGYNVSGPDQEPLSVFDGCVVVDGAGNIVTAWNFNSEGSQNNDMLIVKFDTDGNMIWQRSLETADAEGTDVDTTTEFLTADDEHYYLALRARGDGPLSVGGAVKLPLDGTGIGTHGAWTYQAQTWTVYTRNVAGDQVDRTANYSDSSYTLNTVTETMTAGFNTSTSSIEVIYGGIVAAALVNGDQSLALNNDGTLTFSDDTVQTTAYPGLTRSFSLNEYNYITPFTAPATVTIDGMSYNGGEPISDDAFGPNSSRVALYADSMFAMVAINTDIATVYYNGETGSDSQGNPKSVASGVEDYRGYYAYYNLISGDDPAISQIVISKSSTMNGSNRTTDTNNDDFTVTGLTGSNVVIVLNVYWDQDAGPGYTSSIDVAVTSFIDNVMFDGSSERNNINNIRTAFYANSAAIKTAIQNNEGDLLYDGFEFFRSFQAVEPTGGSGTGAVLELAVNIEGGYEINDILVAGIDYESGDVLYVSGTAVGGVYPTNNVTIGVIAVNADGGITECAVQSGDAVNTLWPQSYIVDGNSDQYDIGNFIGTDRTRVTARATVTRTGNFINGPFGGLAGYQQLNVLTANNTVKLGQWAWFDNQNLGSFLNWAFVPKSAQLTHADNTVTLNVDGSITFPTLEAELHNGDTQTGQVLQFGDATQQAIIYGPVPTGANDSAQRLVIQGARGNGTGEGGDVYVWGGDAEIDGGDIKIYAGDADANSGKTYPGYVNITAGNGPDVGGDVTLSAGYARGTAGRGGDVVVRTGDGWNNHWTFDSAGNLTFPDGTTQSTAHVDEKANLWAQYFSTYSYHDQTFAASSVEYLANGDIVALLNHFTDSPSSYQSITRFNSEGTMLWTVSVIDSQYTDGWGLAVDNVNGFIYVSGQQFGGGGYSVTSLTKLDQADGSVVWSMTYDFGYTSYAAVVDVSGEYPIIVGTANNNGDTYTFVARVFYSDGTVQWIKQIDGIGLENAYGMGVGYDGEIVTVGTSDTIGSYINEATTLYSSPTNNNNWVTGGSLTINDVTFDYTFVNGVPTFTVTGDGAGNRTPDDTLVVINGGDIGGVTGVDDMTVKILGVSGTEQKTIVTKFLDNGTIAWQKAITLNGNEACYGADADVDITGNVYVCGSYSTGGSGRSMYLMKFDPNGNKIWSRKVDGNCIAMSASIVIGDDDYLYLSGKTQDPSSNVFQLLAKYDENGKVVWQRQLRHSIVYTLTPSQFDQFDGSNLAVKNGYIAMAGAVGVPSGPGSTNALIAQFDATGTEWAADNFSWVESTLSGFLYTEAQNITVFNSRKTIYVPDIDTAAMTPEWYQEMILLGQLVTTAKFAGVRRAYTEVGNNTRTLAADDNGKFIYFYGGEGSATVQVPNNYDVPLPIGYTTTLVVDNFYNGSIYVNTGGVIADDLTINAVGYNKTYGGGGGNHNDWRINASGNIEIYTLMKVDVNRWILSGPSISDNW